MKQSTLVLAIVAVLLAGLSGCWEGAPEGQGPGLEQAGESLDEASFDDAAVPDASGKLDGLLRAMVQRPVTPADVRRAVPSKLARLRVQRVDGKDTVMADVFIETRLEALPKLRSLGADVRTVTSSGIVTATVPLSRVLDIAALDDVNRMEAGRSVQLYNDLSNTLLPTPSETTAGMNNPRTHTGTGVIVGVIDTGIDWTHKDFILDSTECDGCAAQTRVITLWDQTDASDDLPPVADGFTYGHEYTAAVINAALAAGTAGDNDPTSPGWTPVTDPAYPIKASAGDKDGHGSHVAGTSAGDGSGSGLAGGAPDAELVIVKFDFDNVAGRNTDTAIVDGINYIFKKAAALGRPAVINMSLGTDYGPHDGTTLEERSIDDLTGPGKVVVVAAGNPGNNNWSQKLRWGYALHGSGALNVEAFTLRIPPYTASATDNYAFFDLFYPAGNKCRVKITTPSGKVYPPNNPAYKSTWVTGSPYTGFNTTEGGLLVGNGGDQLGWGMTTVDQEVYIEISDYWGTLPAAGNWTFTLVPPDSKSKCAGTYHAWYGVSSNIIVGWRNEKVANPLVASTPRFGGRESDNKVTIGSPASANKVIAVAAYQTREEWEFAYGVQPEGACLAEPFLTQAYADPPIGYYDPFALGELASFSGRGPRRDGVLKPEIATPGVGIASALSHFVLHDEWPQKCVSYWNGGPYHFGTNRVLPGNEATVIQGTSMACPNATGAIAVLLQQKGDLNDKCLRKVFQIGARHDAATDIVRMEPNSAFTDSDGTNNETKPVNNDWGYGKMDIANLHAALLPYPVCTSACVLNADCPVGYNCTVAADPCACNTCVAAPTCKPAGTSCTANSQCCSNLCSGKSGKKVCK